MGQNDPSQFTDWKMRPKKKKKNPRKPPTLFTQGFGGIYWWNYGSDTNFLMPVLTLLNRPLIELSSS